jgi:exosortase E/protease (VPEID-CTERM system)
VTPLTPARYTDYVSVPSLNSSVLRPPRFGLLARLLFVLALLAFELLIYSGLTQSPTTPAIEEASRFVHDIQRWVLRFAIAYAGSLVMLLYLRGNLANLLPRDADDVPVRIPWLLTHFALLAPFALLSVLLRSDAPLFPLLSLAWHLCGLAVGLALFAALAPRRVWLHALRQTGAVPMVSLLAAAGALLAFRLSQLLWAPATTLTFHLVGLLLHPLVASLRMDASTQTLMSQRFAVQVSESCSGLEGVGLMLAFCTIWLWYFRREYVFPRALLLIPAAVLLVFLLNAVRIGALLLIGDAGYTRIASLGFHSQAGWIAFNLSALGIAFAAKHSRWLNRPRLAATDVPYGGTTQSQDATSTPRDATAAYLMPLLAILAAGMLTHAVSAGFDFLYALRLLCAIVALWLYRRRYGELNWQFSWRGVLTGAAVFGVWTAVAHWITTPTAMPTALAQLPGPSRIAWIGCRMAAAIVTVPIAEELAYRGFLMRRFENSAFDSIALRNVRWPAIVISAVIFGTLHGNLWFPGILAGLAYGAVAVGTGKIGESVAAHATTNALLAIDVLLFDQWQLW